MTAETVRRDALIVACAISAGVHAALVPGHLAESVAAGVAFAASAIALAVLAGVLTRASANAAVVAGAAVVLVGLLAGYAVAVGVGLPLVHPEPEPVDGLALFTKAVEAVGLLMAATLLRQPKRRTT